MSDLLRSTSSMNSNSRLPSYRSHGTDVIVHGNCAQSSGKVCKYVDGRSGRQWAVVSNNATVRLWIDVHAASTRGSRIGSHNNETDGRSRTSSTISNSSLQTFTSVKSSRPAARMGSLLDSDERDAVCREYPCVGVYTRNHDPVHDNRPSKRVVNMTKDEYKRTVRASSYQSSGHSPLTRYVLIDATDSPPALYGRRQLVISRNPAINIGSYPTYMKGTRTISNMHLHPTDYSARALTPCSHAYSKCGNNHTVAHESTLGWFLPSLKNALGCC